MKIKKDVIIINLLLFLSIILSIFLWRYIFIDFKNPEIFGVYSVNEYHSLNDFLRYAFFIIFPSITYLITKSFIDKNFYLNLKLFFNYSSDQPKKVNGKYSIIFFIMIIYLIQNFFSVDFPLHKFDSYHEGQKLSSAFKSLIDGSLWSGSFVTVGIFYETISSKLLWKIFGSYTIGSIRYGELIYIFITKLLLILLVYNFTFFLKLKFYFRIFFFIFIGLLSNKLIDYNLTTVDLISYRDIPVILIAILFTSTLRFNNNFIFLILISLLSPLSMIWGIDRGLVCNILIITILLNLLFHKDLKNFLFLFFFIIVSWILLILTLKNEFIFFIENTYLIFKNMNYVHGLIHPTPFSFDPNSGRATKTLVLILFCFLFSLSIIFNNKYIYSNNFKKLFLFLSIISVLSYIYALGRSDGSHIKHTFGFPLLTFFILILYNFLSLIEKKKIKGGNVILLFIIICLIIYNNAFNLNNLVNYKSRLKNFVNQDDYFFLNKGEIEFVKFIRPMVENYECVQLFTNDAAFNYLLKKKSCTKYYFVWSSTPKGIQKKFINELSDTEIIIKGGSKNNWEIPIEKKLYLVNNHIDNHFNKAFNISEWSIYIRN